MQVTGRICQNLGSNTHSISFYKAVLFASCPLGYQRPRKSNIRYSVSQKSRAIGLSRNASFVSKTDDNLFTFNIHQRMFYLRDDDNNA